MHVVGKNIASPSESDVVTGKAQSSISSFISGYALIATTAKQRL